MLHFSSDFKFWLFLAAFLVAPMALGFLIGVSL